MKSPFARRALFFWACSFGAGCALMWPAFSAGCEEIVLGLGVAALTFSLLFKRLRVAAVCLLLGAAALLCQCRALERTEELTGALSGRALSVQLEEEKTAVLLTDWSLDGQKQPHRVRLYLDFSADIRPDDEVEIGYAVLTPPSAPRNFEGSDGRISAWSKGASYNAWAQRVKVIPRDTFAGRLFALRRAVEERIDKTADAQKAGIMKSLLFGGSAGADEQTREDFRRAGVAHLLAVSGLHVGIVLRAVDWLIGLLMAPWMNGSRRRRIGGWIRLALCICLLIPYCMMTGAPASVLRAGIMALYGRLGRCLGEKTDSLNSLGLAALILLCFRPVVLMSAGFLLSFCAVLGIALIAPCLQGAAERCLKSKVLKSLTAALGVTLGAQLGVLPVQLLYFGEISLAGLLTNLLVTPAFGIVLLLCFLGAVLGGWGIPLLQLAALLLGPLMKLVSTVAAWEWACLYPGALNVCGVLAAVCLMLALSTFACRRGRILGLAVVLAVFSLAVTYYKQGELELTFLDVGQGDAAVLRLGGRTVLIDGGESNEWQDAGENALLPLLRKNGGRKIDAIFLSHPHKDHFSGLTGLLKYYSPELLILGNTQDAEEGFEEFMQAAEQAGARVIFAEAGDRLKIGEMKFDILSTGTQSGNEASLFIRAEYQGVSALFTGDAGREGEWSALSSLEQSDILKIGHHGSAESTTDALLEKVRPRYGIISAGKNNLYGHPHGQVLERLEKADVRVLRTDLCGGVRFKIRQGRLRLKTAKNIG